MHVSRRTYRMCRCDSTAALVWTVLFGFPGGTVMRVEWILSKEVLGSPVTVAHHPHHITFFLLPYLLLPLYVVVFKFSRRVREFLVRDTTRCNAIVVRAALLNATECARV